MPIEMTCPVCGTVFQRRPANGGRFCSRSCALTWRWNQSPESPAHKQRAAQRNRATSPRPQRETLYRLHVDEGLSAPRIAEQYRVQAAAHLAATERAERARAPHLRGAPSADGNADTDPERRGIAWFYVSGLLHPCVPTPDRQDAVGLPQSALTHALAPPCVHYHGKFRA